MLFNHKNAIKIFLGSFFIFGFFFVMKKISNSIIEYQFCIQEQDWNTEYKLDMRTQYTFELTKCSHK